MKIIIATMYFHVHNNGGGGVGRIYPYVENKHRPYHPMALAIENDYLRYPLMGFKKI